MTLSIRVLELKDGRRFEVGEPFPGDERMADDSPNRHEQVVVGPIFLFPTITEDVEYESAEPRAAKPAASDMGDGDDDEEEDDDVDSRLEAVPAHYEIWAVNEAMYIAFFGGFKGIGNVQVDRKALIEKMAGTTMMRMVVYVDAVLGHYDEWPSIAAYAAMMDRMDAQQAEVTSPPPAPANGSARAQV